MRQGPPRPDRPLRLQREKKGMSGAARSAWTALKILLGGALGSAGTLGAQHIDRILTEPVASAEQTVVLEPDKNASPGDIAPLKPEDFLDSNDYVGEWDFHVDLGADLPVPSPDTAPELKAAWEKYAEAFLRVIDEEPGVKELIESIKPSVPKAPHILAKAFYDAMSAAKMDVTDIDVVRAAMTDPAFLKKVGERIPKLIQLYTITLQKHRV